MATEAELLAKIKEKGYPKSTEPKPAARGYKEMLGHWVPARFGASSSGSSTKRASAPSRGKAPRVAFTDDFKRIVETYGVNAMAKLEAIRADLDGVIKNADVTIHGVKRKAAKADLGRMFDGADLDAALALWDKKNPAPTGK